MKKFLALAVILSVTTVVGCGGEAKKPVTPATPSTPAAPADKDGEHKDDPAAPATDPATPATDPAAPAGEK